MALGELWKWTCPDFSLLHKGVNATSLSPKEASSATVENTNVRRRLCEGLLITEENSLLLFFYFGDFSAACTS